jgi:PhnB protein
LEREFVVASTSTYLNFARETEEAFNFYKSVFKTEFAAPIARFSDVPVQPDQPPMPEADKNLVMNVQLPITGGHMLMGTDAPSSMGFKLHSGNNVYICLDPDTRTEAERLFGALSEGGEVEMALQDMFWGDLFGSLTDKYGIQWMINCSAKS